MQSVTGTPAASSGAGAPSAITAKGSELQDERYISRGGYGTALSA
jgi:hypothetical protein